MSGRVLAPVRPWQSSRALLTAPRQRALRHGMYLAGLIGAALAGWRAWQGPAIDAHAYWVNRPPLDYGAVPGAGDAFLYSPAFAQLLAPITALPWEAFLGLWLALLLVALAWLTGPLLAVAVLLTGNEIWYGNIHFLLAAAIVVGFRHPAAWSFVLLTKVTPGVGLAWFVGRRDFRSLGIAVGATAAIASASALVDPAGWLGWLQLLERSAREGAGHGFLVPGPLWLRALVGLALAWWGGRTDRPWTVPLAAFLALPHGTIGSALLVGTLPLLVRGRLGSPAAAFLGRPSGPG